MSIKKFLCFIVFAFAISVFASEGNLLKAANTPAKPAGRWLAAPQGWSNHLGKSLILAVKEKKKILVLNTGSDWCGWCKKMQEEVFSKPEFKKLAKENFILVYLDSPSNKPMPVDQRLYNKKMAALLGFEGGVPDTLIIDSNGKKYGVFSGYADPGKYMDFLVRTLYSIGK